MLLRNAVNDCLFFRCFSFKKSSGVWGKTPNIAEATHSIIFKNSASSITLIPSACALVSLLPASVPHTTRSVFFERLMWLRRRSSAIFSSASVRVMLSSLPVTTTVIPLNTPPTAFAASSRGETPNSSSLSISLDMRSSAKSPQCCLDYFAYILNSYKLLDGFAHFRMF